MATAEKLDGKSPHWAQQLADDAIARKKPPFVISAGITTSGPAHLGTLCEFLYPAKVRDLLVKKGQEAKFYFFADILDAFDSIPASMAQYEKELAPHLGKPLNDVPDPTGTSRSFGDHFLDEVRAIMLKFGVEAEVVRINEVYASGKVDGYARLFLKNEAQAREIIERTSGKKFKDTDYWSPIMPICAKCGKIATTRVVSHEGENYEYACDRDVKYVKGCGFSGKGSISEHKYKLMWRLHWPMWQDLYGTSIEGAGMDHFTKGGSRDTLEAVAKEIFNKEPSIGYKYGFVLFEGKKYSKSKGIGMGVSDLMKLLPPEVITFILVRPDLEENKDINPTKESMLKMVEEYEQSQAFADKPEETDRAGQKRAMAYSLAGKRHWSVPFRDALMHYAVEEDWEKAAQRLGDNEGVVYIRPFIEEWVKRGFVPDEFNFKYAPVKAEGKVGEFFASLQEGMDAIAIHNAVFNFAKENAIAPGDFFRQVYLTLIRKERGPKVGKFIDALGVARVKRDVL